MATRVWVKAVEGVEVPMEGSRRKIGQTPVRLTLTSYYRRLMQVDGDLVQVEPPAGGEA